MIHTVNSDIADKVLGNNLSNRAPAGPSFPACAQSFLSKSLKITSFLTKFNLSTKVSIKTIKKVHQICYAVNAMAKN